MCTLAVEQIDDDLDETDTNIRNCHSPSNSEILSKKSTCGKCKSDNARISVQGTNNVYCQECFLLRTTHKFRATLGKHKVIRRGDTLLIGHSGKPNSTALLHLVKKATEETTHKKLILVPKVLYIDDGAVKGRTIEQRLAILQDMKVHVEMLQIPGYWVLLSDCLKEKLTIKDVMCLQSDLDTTNHSADDIEHQDAALQETLDNLEDDTAKSDLIRQMKRNLLISAARLLGCVKVLVADTSTDLAIKILADTGTGRAANLSSEVAFLDDKYSSLMLLRPMREFTEDEVETYLREHNLTAPIAIDKCNKFPNSVKNVARHFVCELEAECRGTVAAIYRTGDKLRSNTDSSLLSRDSENKEIHCALCGARINSRLSYEGDPRASLLTVEQATSFSKQVSSPEDSSTSTLSEQQTQENCRNCRCEKQYCDLTEIRLDNYLCYGCKTIFRGSKVNGISSVVPPYIRRNISKALIFESMRQDIGDFLL